VSGSTLFTFIDNSPPTVDNEIQDQNTFEQIAFDFTVPNNTFSDPDSDPLTYSATLANDTALPDWLTFNPSTQTFSGTPANTDIGTISVKVTATDTGNLSESDTFDLTIEPLQTLVTNSTGGNDILTGGIGFNLINGGGGNDSISGNLVADSLSGGSGNDTLNGLDGDDLLGGGSGNDLLNSGNGNDIIGGGSGNDTLTGGMGNDTLNGGSGNDVFLFNSSEEGKDTITDFKVTEDKIWVNSNGFNGLPLGPLDVSAFVRGSSATTDAHRFIYDPSTGLLSFDGNGDAYGGSIELAQLRSGLALTNDNIIVFGNSR
jgi:Ca2+-binding RTX toxin-like protein